MYIYIWVIDVACRLKKEPDFFLNYHNSGSFYFLLLLKREISDKRCHCWTFTIFIYQAFIDFHSRPSHIYTTFWVTHFCEHQPAQSTRGLNAGQMRSCLQPFDQAVQWNSSWEFKYHCLVRLFFPPELMTVACLCWKKNWHSHTMKAEASQCCFSLQDRPRCSLPQRDPDMMIKVHWICFPFVMWKLFLAMNMRQKSQTNTSVTALIVLLTLLIRKDLTCQQKPIIASLLV